MNFRMSMKGKIISINISDEKKKPKRKLETGGYLIKNVGLEGDAYNKPPVRQISLISTELLTEQYHCPRVGKGELFIVGPGDFSETLTIEGIDISKISIGDIFQICSDAKIRITEKGMTCFKFCPWEKAENECPLPKHFLFAEVLESGTVSVGDEIKKT